MPKQNIVELRDVVKNYRLGNTIVKALRGISFEIRQGDFAIVIGPSGSGKSTLLHLMGALDKPTSGEVFIKGKNISLMDEWSLAMLRRKTIGFVFQTFNLVPTLNALENVMIPLEPVGLDSLEKIRRAEKLLSLVGLKNRSFHKPAELSGGERQRVAIARALINDPEIILADEPTGNLDSKTGLQIVSSMKKLNEKEVKTFVLVTHDLSLLKYGNKHIYIRDGLIEKIR